MPEEIVEETPVRGDHYPPRTIVNKLRIQRTGELTLRIAWRSDSPRFFRTRQRPVLIKNPGAPCIIQQHPSRLATESRLPQQIEGEDTIVARQKRRLND